MKPYYNDTRAIAEQLIFLDTHICQMAELAHQKIRTFKLSYTVPAYQDSHDQLYELVKRSLLNYVTAKYILKQEKSSLQILSN